MRSFKRMMAGLLCLTMLLISCSSGFCSVASPPEADPSPSVSPGESGEPEESPSPSPSPSVSPGESGEPEESASPSPSPSVSPGESGEPEESASPGPSPSVSPGESGEPEESASPNPSPSVSPGESGGPEESPSPSPSPSVPPGEEGARTFTPTGEAWARLADGTLLDGTTEKGDLQEILDEIAMRGETEKATVYIRSREEITLENIAEKFLENSVDLLPDPELFDKQQYIVTWHTIESKTRGLPPIVVAVKHVSEIHPTASPTPEVTPTPISLTVDVQGLEPDVWKKEAPTFTLSGIEQGSEEYVYGVFICNERLVLLSQDTHTYTPTEEGEVSLRFAILDRMGDVAVLSDEYTMLLDFTPPDVPWLESAQEDGLALRVITQDTGSGLDAVSFDGGQTWTPWPTEGEAPLLTGEEGGYVDAGRVVVRDKAGNTAANEEMFFFGGDWDFDLDPGPIGGGGGGSGSKPIKHVKETMDYSKANYNALELEFAQGPQTELIAGDTQLNMVLLGEEGDTAQPFTARLETWQRYEDVKPKSPNALVLSACPPQPDALSHAQQEQGDLVTWRFTGDVYKLLYNSGVDFLVLLNGDYMTAIPTEGFTAGTQYAKLKAAGVSTRRFDYTVSQDETLRETAISVTVDEETWLLEEDRAQPMYRYNVLIGTDDMMEKPFESYLPEEEP